MKWPVLKCPACNATLDNNKVRVGKPLVCPSCSAELQLSERQGYKVELFAVAITPFICYLFGLRGLWLLLVSVVMWFPVFVGCLFVFYRIVPPKFEPYRPLPTLPQLPTPPWKQPKFVTLFPRESVDGDKPKKADRTEDKPPKGS